MERQVAGETSVRSVHHIASATGTLFLTSAKTWRLPEGGPSTPHLPCHFLPDSPRECVYRVEWWISLGKWHFLPLKTCGPTFPTPTPLPITFCVLGPQTYSSVKAHSPQCDLVQSSRWPWAGRPQQPGDNRDPRLLGHRRSQKEKTQEWGANHRSAGNKRRSFQAPGKRKQHGSGSHRTKYRALTGTVVF